MLSPDSSVPEREATRRRLELALRIVALVALTVSLMQVAGIFGGGRSNSRVPVLFRSHASASGEAVASTTTAERAGAAATTTTAVSAFAGVVQRALLDAGSSADVAADVPRPIHLVAAQVPENATRALASAARIAGVPVSWTDSTNGDASIAVEVQPLLDPRGGYTLRVAAPDDVQVALSDSLGLIDSVRTHSGGASVEVGRVAGAVRARAAGGQAVTIVPQAAALRRVLLISEPGWEGKFTAAALEERGWVVDVRYAIGKNVTVTQGAPTSPDTARYALVVALDSSALAQVSAIRRYVSHGGGLIVAGAALTLREFGDLLPGRAGARQPGVPGALETSTPLQGLAWRPIVADSTSTVLERNARNADNKYAAVVVHRYVAGRVAAVAYDGIWEWRMAGPDGSVDAHRQWWSSVASAVAFAPEYKVDAEGFPLRWHADEPGDGAPLADTYARLGNSVRMPTVTVKPTTRFPWELVFASIAIASLLAEWSSRRLRGAR